MMPAMPKPTEPTDTRQALQDAIAALQAQRALLGDALVDAALAPLLQRLADAQTAVPPAPPTRSEPQRALRQVSVLFLDIVGSTQLIQQLDPEDVQAVVDGALAAFTTIVTQHGGEVLRYAGDNIKAAFGANGTREDDAERAVLCGLALLQEAARRGQAVQQEQGYSGFNARVGIHTGAAVRGGGIEQGHSLSGLAVNVAARMEQAAPAGTLRISQDTWALVRGLFDADVQPPLQVKGHDEPIVSWLVHGAKPRAFRLPTRGIEGRETRLIGRDTELALFDSLLEGLLADRLPRALTLIADAGLGKSRLLHEFQHRLSAHPASWWLMLARAQPASALQPYGLLRDLLARRFDIADSDSAEVAKGKLVQGLVPWLAEPGDPAPELLGQLIGFDFSAAPAVQRLGSDAGLLRDRALAALGLWLARLSASDGAPVVLLLDDLHWSDEASLDALAPLLAARQSPLLALLCARPALMERRPAWGEGLPRHQQLTLQPLQGSRRAALTRALLGRLGTVPDRLAELIERQAEGNPFYAEELVKMLLDQRVIESDDGHWHFHAARLQPGRLPTTLTGVLQARFDALEPGARHAQQMASVIGPVFWSDALRALDANGPAELPVLQSRAMVLRRPTSAFEGTDELAFHHHLLHQVCYDTVLKPERRAAHARAAAWLTERVGGRGDETTASTAEHHARAGQHALAAEWFVRAAREAHKRSAYRVALQHLDRADAEATMTDEPLAPEHRAEVLNLRQALCDSLSLRDMQAEASRQLLALGEAHDNPAWIAGALSQQTLMAFRTGDLVLAEAAARRGAEVGAKAGVPKDVFLCQGNLAWMAIERRELDTARQHLALAAEAAVRSHLKSGGDALYEAQCALIEAELHRAEHDDTARGAALRRAVALTDGGRWPRMECNCYNALAEHALDRAAHDEAAPNIAAMARRSAEFGLTQQAAVARQMGVRLHLQSGRWSAAAQEAAAAMREFRAARDVVQELQAGAYEAEAHWRAGDGDAAVRLWQAGLAVREQRGDVVEARVLRLRLADAVAGGGDAAARAALAVVQAELPALQAQGALATVSLGLAARLAAWRVLARAGEAAAAGQLALATAELRQVLAGFSEPEVRRRVAEAIPWHRDVLDALGPGVDDFWRTLA